MYKYAKLILIAFIFALILNQTIAYYIAGGFIISLLLFIFLILLTLIGISIIISEFGDFIYNLFGLSNPEIENCEEVLSDNVYVENPNVDSNIFEDSGLDITEIEVPDFGSAESIAEILGNLFE